MPTEKINIGMVTALTQNTVYALPAVQCVLYTDTASPTIVLSDDVAFTTNTAVTLTVGVATVNGAFIKATTTGVNVTLKRA